MKYAQCVMKHDYITQGGWQLGRKAMSDILPTYFDFRTVSCRVGGIGYFLFNSQWSSVSSAYLGTNMGCLKWVGPCSVIPQEVNKVL